VSKIVLGQNDVLTHSLFNALKIEIKNGF
jgi:hypothetical protein